MKVFSIDEVASFTGGEIVSRGNHFSVKGFSIDSRTVRQGDVFIAVKGASLDGHDFIGQALEKGAAAVIAERPLFPKAGTSGSCFILVPDTIRAMSLIASEIRRYYGIPVVCVTGTNGKTTVKEMVWAALSRRYKVLKSRASYNNVFGVCLSLFDMDDSYGAAVLELGTNSPGEIGELASIALPDFVIITNIGDGHLEHLRDRRGVFEEKVSILNKISPGGLAVLNGDDDMLANFRDRRSRILFYGSGDNCDVKIENVKTSGSGIEFFVDGEPFFFPGEARHNAWNAAAAICLAKNMGIGTGDIREGISKTTLPSMRLEKIISGGIVFLNDSYNANPSSFNAAVETLANFSARERWVVAGDMLELGDDSVRMHRELGRKIKLSNLDFLITIGDMAGEVAEGARGSGMSGNKIYPAGSHAEAAGIIMEKAAPGAAVLVKGSRLMKMEEVIKCFITCCTR
jgi:UDP-N-acetylmuramoyl-tripeptide--D-alanyl-D-alanine ligase